MNHTSKKCVMLELTEVSGVEPTKLINGSIPHVFDHEVEHHPRALQQNNTRRRMATYGSLFLAIALVVALIVPFALQLRSSSLLEARLAFIRRVLVETPLVDGHWSSEGNITDDVSNMYSSLVAAHFWPVLVPCGAQFLDAVQIALEKLDEVRRLVGSHSQHLELIDSADELESAHITGRVAVVMGIEGGHALGDSLGVLRSLYLLGARFLTITHACNTVWADASIADDPPEIQPAGFVANGGLTEFGESIIMEMNRLGMIIDLSHVSEKTMHDVLSISKAPIVFSHSGAQALCNSTLNVPDSVLTRLAVNGGIVMINVRACQDSRIENVIAHINHVRRIAGVNHVGLGGDADSEYPPLLAELARDRHWSTEAIRKLVGVNLLRVFREVEAARDSIQHSANSIPEEDIIPAEALDGKTYCRYPGI